MTDVSLDAKIKIADMFEITRSLDEPKLGIRNIISTVHCGL
jgi:hypothetical protein